jgi:endoplasmic reticulum protein 29
MALRIATLLAAVELVLGYTDRGILKLDNTTFDRIIDGTKSVFVRFDKEYSYGDEHDAWKDFAAKVGDSSAEMLVCDVGVSEYGDKENSDLSDRYSIKSDDFPQYRLWLKSKPSSADPVVYKGEKKSDGFLRFVQAEAGVWVGLPGQLKEFDELAKEFGKDATAAKKKAEVAVAKVSEKDADAAKYYVKVMTKAATASDFITKETERLQKMIDDGSVKATKKEQFGRRLNILSSFQ